jgi:uncharacterized RDD family membrane protein YckC
MTNGEKNIAELGPRIAAVIIDHIIVGIVAGIFLVIFGISMALTRGFGMFFGLPVILTGFFLPFLYFTFFEAYMQGQTLGKMLFKIRVVKMNGEPITIGESLIRNLLRIIDVLFFYLVGFIFMAMSDKKQRLGDMAADTIVVPA